MRYLLFGFALASISSQAFGQTALQQTPSLDLRPPVPRTYSLNPKPAAGKVLTEPGIGLPFRKWQDVLANNTTEAGPGNLILKRGKTTAFWADSGHCSVPLIEIPLPDESFDKRFVRKMRPHPDDKMALAPPPVCQLHREVANPLKRK
jgi:hypothetical protein